MIDEKVGKSLGSDVLVAPDEDGSFGQHTHKSCNAIVGKAIVAIGQTRWKIGDEISGDMGPGAIRVDVRAEETRFTASRGLGTLAG